MVTPLQVRHPHRHAKVADPTARWFTAPTVTVLAVLMVAACGQAQRGEPATPTSVPSVTASASTGPPHAGGATSTDQSPAQETDDVQIQLTIGDTVMTAILADNQAARALTAQLPLNLSVRDFHGTEKIADLPERLPTPKMSEGIEAAPGALTYYAPWGNLALFYQDFEYSPGLIHLGHIDSDPSVLADIPDGTSLSIELL